MTLIMTVFAAVFVTYRWYVTETRDLHTGMLCYMFWGASVMWFVDFCVEYAQEGAAVFTPAPIDVLNDTLLGLAVIALALTIWIVTLLLRDPRGVVYRALRRDHKECVTTMTPREESEIE